MEEKVFTVGDLTWQIQEMLEGEFAELWVEGEISNFRRQSSGHCYFTLKDENAQLACVMFRGSAARQNMQDFRDGMKVRAMGRITVYPPHGKYQLQVQLLQEEGVGALQAKFEELKRKLAAEGLFATERKKKIPEFPQVIGLVTSPTSAAIRDLFQVFERRSPWIRLLVFPVKVQGKGAAEEVAEAIDFFNKNLQKQVDVLIVGRGGGSLEDLWAFNEEVVARAIATSVLPVISAVGHEIDFTIADMVADLRAATPSAAAEMASMEQADFNRQLETLRRRMTGFVSQRIQLGKSELSRYSGEGLNRLIERYLERKIQDLSYLEERFIDARQTLLNEWQERIHRLELKLQGCRPEQKLEQAKYQLNTLQNRLNREVCQELKRQEEKVARYRERVTLLGPQSALDRGFTLTLSPDGKLLRTKKEMLAEKTVVTRFKDGEVQSRPL